MLTNKKVKAPIEAETAYPKLIHKLWALDDPRQEYVKYASSIGGLEFTALLDAENGLWNIDRKSDLSYYVAGSKWVKGEWREAGTYWDYGFCQVSEGYHPHIVRDERFYTDWKWQINQCLKLYKGGTKFYGMNNVWKTKARFARESTL